MVQSQPPQPPQETLPTMYDLPSEGAEDPGAPDTFHLLQPRLLDDTFRPPAYDPDEYFTASDLNLYYDGRHPQWCKRPDWFAAVGVSRLYQGKDLRLSYVVWQESVFPFVVIELLSPSTQKEDLGGTLRSAEKPPAKWEVYQNYLRVPYYVVFDRYSDVMRAFVMQADRYVELELTDPKIWMPGLELGLGLWQGRYRDHERLWLRWYGAEEGWMLTPEEQERQRAERERQRAERLAIKLRELGVNPDDL